MLKGTIRKSLMLLAGVFMALPLMGHTGCRIHSPGQEELAKDVKNRYEKITPSALDALESLDADLEKLVESERADFEVLKETSENKLLDSNWTKFRDEAEELRSKFYPLGPDGKPLVIEGQAQGGAAEIKGGITTETDTIAHLGEQIKTLSETVGKLDEAIGKAEERKTLPESLAEAKTIINGTVSALHKAVAANPNSEITKRLSGSIGEINKLLADLDKLEKNRKESKRVFSLVIEAMRVGRDIAALELEAVVQEQNFHKRLLKLYQAAEKLVPTQQSLINIRDKYTVVGFPNGYQYPPDELIRIRLTLLARGSAASEERRRAALADILNDLSTIQSLSLTNQMRLQELELRRKAEGYRNARLKDAIYERQRMTLISYGLEGVVRYSEGGWRSDDIASLINIARLIAEVVIAARV